MYVVKSNLGTKNILFVAIPALIIAIVVIAIDNLLIKNLWWKIGFATIMFMAFAFFHSFKNGNFEKIHWRLKHAKYQQWDTHYDAETQFMQVLCASGVLAGYVCLSLNQTVPVHPYGSLGLTVSLLVELTLILVTLHFEKKEVKEGAKQDIIDQQTIMYIIGSVILTFLLTECYLLWATWYVLIPIVTGSLIILAVATSGILPLTKKAMSELQFELQFVAVILAGSLITQFWNTVLFWQILFIGLVTFVIISQIRQYWLAQKKKLRVTK